MAQVTGVGGFFFRAGDSKRLAEWYETHLGITELWSQSAGMTVFAPFSASTDYFRRDKEWMITLRVDDLDGMMAGLRAAAIEIETRADWDTPETGRFARIHDPEGNMIELWEPPQADGISSSA